jgi:hypothetical protein
MYIHVENYLFLQNMCRNLKLLTAENTFFASGPVVLLHVHVRKHMRPNKLQYRWSIVYGSKRDKKREQYRQFALGYYMLGDRGAISMY